MAFKLSDVRKKIEPVELADGNEYEVREPDAAAMEMLVEYYQMSTEDKILNVKQITNIVKRILPTAPDELLQAFSPSEQGAVIAHAMGKINVVHEELKNE